MLEQSILSDLSDQQTERAGRTMPPKKSAGAATDKTGRTGNDKTTTKKRKQVGQTICDICNVAITEGTDEALDENGCIAIVPVFR